MKHYLWVLMLFTFARASETFILLFGHQLGISVVELLLLWAVLNLAKAITSTQGGRLADHSGRGALILIGWSALAVSFLTLSQVTTSIGLWMVSVFYGLLMGMSEGAERALISDYALANERGTAFGWYHLVCGVAAIPAGLLFGVIWHVFGAAAAFLFAGLLALLATILLRLWLGPCGVTITNKDEQIMMEWLTIVLSTFALGFMFWFFSRNRKTLQLGQPAPDFKLVDQHGNIHTLADFQGKWLALYFYPKDDTPGCTKQACAFRDGFQELTTLGAEVIGVSVDGANSHADFSRKHHLPFPLLADITTETAARYHSLINLGIIKFAKRNTFLIDPQGKIARMYLSASAARNSAEVIGDLKSLQAV
jgi:peroxiredoxin Q/BCP